MRSEPRHPARTCRQRESVADLPAPLPLLSDNGREVTRLASQRARIMAALERCGGNQTRAARLLGISRATLLRRIDSLDLPRPRKRNERE